MGALIEVKYFNSFILKKVIRTAPNPGPAFNGSFGIPKSIGGYNVIDEDDLDSASSWAVEEARIRGGYNNTNVDYGVRAYLVEDEPDAVIRGNSLIYSGIFNSRTGVNDTNVFSVAEEITKSADPANGSIQRLYAEDTNLIIFQEAKVSRALIDKDAIYTAEGGASITNINTTIGTIQPYAGEFGISRDPGSFAVYGYRKYFTDRNKNAVLRLSMDGLTEISNYGMYDYFRDQLNNIDTSSSIGVIKGGWDIHSKQFTLCSSQSIANPAFNTLAFDESVRGWTSFFSYNPDQMLSLKNNFYTFKNGSLFQHYTQVDLANQPVPRGRFYGVSTPTSISFVFNPNVSMSKVFQTINYEGSNGWQVNTFTSDQTGKDLYSNPVEWKFTEDTTNTSNPLRPSVWSYVQGSYDDAGNVYPSALSNPVRRAGFDRKENKYFSNLVNTSVASQGEVLFGGSISGIKGYFATVTISTDTVTDPGGLKELFAASSNYVESSY
tara:strand:+ start:4871 stop:6349 length:1479 start_codon:yes stop_codon:yes gene_type:complete